MAIFDTLKALIAARIHDNTEQEITAKDVRDSFDDTIDAINTAKEDALPAGTAGQVLTKKADGGVEWATPQAGLDIHGQTTEDTLADSDEFAFYDASASANRKTVWSNIRAKLKSAFDSIYAGAVSTQTALDGKAAKVSGATAGNLAGLDANGNLTDSGSKPSDFATAAQVADIEDMIPSAASDTNQLADKAFVNSSISTNTATFRGTYNLVSDLSLTTSATQAQVATALLGTIAVADNNDYAFVQIPTADATPSEIARIDRYKFNGTSWAYEYSLNNSSFTAVQWAAINSGITSGDVALIASAVQPGDLAAVATSGSYADLNNLPTIPVVESLTNAEIDTIWNAAMA